MTIEATSTEVKTETPAPAAATAPQVDVAALKKEMNDVLESHKKQIATDAEARLQKAAAALSGKKEEVTVDPALQMFVKDPLGTFNELKEIAKRETKAELKNESAEASKNKQLAVSAAEPFFRDYPQINDPENLELADALYDKNLRNGMSIAEATKSAFEKVVKTKGLQSAEELRKSGARNYAGIPPVGGSSGFGAGKPPKSEADIGSDFITGLRSKTNSFRVRAPK